MDHGIEPPGFRLPIATRVGVVRLQVRALERSVRYYEQVLGLRVQSATHERATLGSHGDPRPLLELQSRPGVMPARPGALGLYHFAILLPDRPALARFAAHLSALGVKVGTADHAVSEAFYLWDPDGLGIEVYADRPRSSWRHRAGELVMTTEPLDIGSLTAVLGEGAWEGMPVGTRMGHVHLHVGSLVDAEAFYHRGLGLDKTVWSYPGALFLAAGGYHHHLGTNVWSSGPSALEDEARLLEWELVVPSADDLSEVGQSLRAGGYVAENTGAGCTTADPWGTRLRIVMER